jgi:hypothetical protein
MENQHDKSLDTGEDFVIKDFWKAIQVDPYTL